MRLFELDYSVMVDRLRSVYTLTQRAEIEGERTGAELAFKRLLASIERDYGKDKAAEAERLIKSPGRQERPKARPRQSYREPPKREPPRQKQKPKGSSDHYVYHGWTFKILRDTDPSAGKRGKDRIWGYAEKNGKYTTFWGGFGKTVRTKEVFEYEALKKYQQKLAKGYQLVYPDPIDYGYLFTQSESW